MGSAIKKANQVLDASASGNGITADELEIAADELQKAIESVVSAGLPKSHALVAESTELCKSLRDESSKTKVSALHVVSVLESI